MNDHLSTPDALYLRESVTIGGHTFIFKGELVTQADFRGWEDYCELVDLVKWYFDSTGELPLEFR